MAMTKSSLWSSNGDNDRVLVLVRLNGGNDGLNTLIPLDQYANLAQARSNIIQPEASLLEITSKNALHPAMTGMHNMWNNGNLSIIQNVGYPNQNRSHFRSNDIWHTASDADQVLTTGWLGRCFDNDYPDFPSGYPNDDKPDPFAISIGNVVSETCQGESSNFSFALTGRDSLANLEETVEGSEDNTCYGSQLSFIKTTIQQSNAYSATILESFDQGSNIIEYPETELAQQLKIVANLISGGLQTKVYVVTLGGFDNHADQVVEGDVTTGKHSELLSILSGAISSFQADLVALNIDTRVVGMTYSEFGRAIRSNFSLGTDHGTAAPLFVFGSCINPTILGDNPQIADVVGDQEGVPMQYDFRTVYASILVDWLEVEEEVVANILGEPFQRIPIIKACDTTSIIESVVSQIDIAISPNPVSTYTYLSFNSTGGHTAIDIYDLRGTKVKNVVNRAMAIGTQKLEISMFGMVAGVYYLRIAQSDVVKNVRLVKL